MKQERSLGSLYQKRSVQGKDIFIVESHHFALVPWLKLRAQLNAPPFLISLDHHTDSLDAFLNYYGRSNMYRHVPEDYAKLKAEWLRKIQLSDESVLNEAISVLRHDEHIDAAISTATLQAAFVISYSWDKTPSIEENEYFQEAFGENQYKNLLEGRMVPYPSRPFTYEVPPNRIFKIKDTVGYPVDGYTDKDIRPHFDMAIESDYLRSKFSIINEMARALGIENIIKEPYILDIDLDYFKTLKSIEPADKDWFQNLVRKSLAITIATEPVCVRELKLDKKVTSDFLLEKLLGQIETSLSDSPS